MNRRQVFIPGEPVDEADDEDDYYPEEPDDAEVLPDIEAEMLKLKCLANAPVWRCTSCQEENPGTFETCWKCDAGQTPSLTSCADRPR